MIYNTLSLTQNFNLEKAGYNILNDMIPSWILISICLVILGILLYMVRKFSNKLTILLLVLYVIGGFMIAITATYTYHNIL